MKMKRIVALLLVLAFAMALTACGGNAPPAPGGSSGTTQTPSPAPTPAPGNNTQPAGSEEPWAEKPEVTLILAHYEPEHALPGLYTQAWADAVYEESRGRIEIQVNAGGALAGPTEMISAAKSGLADITWGLQSLFAGQFPMSDVLIMPFMPFETSVQASEAFLDIWYNTDFLQSDPGYEGLHVILIRSNCDTPIITANKKITSTNDLRGMTFRATIAPLVKWLAEFGANGQGSQIAELFQLLQNGTFDGALTDWHGVGNYRLYDNCAKYFADERVQWNLHFFVMNQDSYDSLSPENKAVIDKLSGYGALEIRKDSWDEFTTTTKATVLAQAGNEIYRLDPAVLASLREAAEKTNQEYIDSLGERGQQLWDRFSQTFPKL